ncbi:DUF892 family protein [Mucilaginibacter gotjawali]|uniref:Uncharacterized protein n=2 Tax=Mucilaginibacter gotjawali TaxID=1550579 RepID=A0A0X8X2U6_9SPHI|nr:DUF892 family protein [Mucilaginibacter gotjawali]MBB3055887.1 uncharacterized protein (TIGR02284 family) [Mucilaginibacter gotjawali]BAU54709.1 hypothetical protein MgSA37_02887 [Mucilaginibacter gotjawali]
MLNRKEWRNGVAMMENNFDTGLRELADSSFMVVPGTTDITGWSVLDQRGQVIGEIAGLLFDEHDASVRYLIIALRENADYHAKRIVVPVGLAKSRPADLTIILPEVSDGQIAALPAYEGVSRLAPDVEMSIRNLLEGHGHAPYEHPQFYAHAHFNEDRLYDTTDISAAPAEVTEARAERARRIVARLDHAGELQNNQKLINNYLPMEISEKALDVINDLIKINNDRVAGFEKAGTDLEGDDNGLIAVFNKLAGESQQYVVELTDIVQQYGGEAAEGTSTSGDLHRAWIDIKATFTGNDLLAVLNECERGEDAAKAAYRDALYPQNELSPELVQVLQLQQQGITEGHNLIKSLRDQVETDDTEGQNDQPVYQELNMNNGDTGETLFDGEAPVAEPSFDGAAGEYQQAAGYAPEPGSIEHGEEWQEEQVPSSGNSKLMEFFVDELKDLLWAERKLVDTLPDMAEAATSQELKTAFINHLAETEVHVSRLEQIFGILGLEPETTKCDAMSGIVDEGDEVISHTDEGSAQRDVGLIFAGQKAEHYEIASYGGMISLAKTLGYYEIAELLVLTIDEEKTADALLTQIAENHVNYEASTETAD